MRLRGRSFGGAGVGDVLSVTALFDPQSRSANSAGAAVDRNTLAAGARLAAVQQVGEATAGTTVSGRVEESADGVAGWATVASFAAVEDPGGAAEYVKFTPTQRFVRWAATVAGGDPGALLSAALVAYR